MSYGGDPELGYFREEPELLTSLNTVFCFSVTLTVPLQHGRFDSKFLTLVVPLRPHSLTYTIIDLWLWNWVPGRTWISRSWKMIVDKLCVHMVYPVFFLPTGPL